MADSPSSPDGPPSSVADDFPTFSATTSVAGRSTVQLSSTTIGSRVEASSSPVDEPSSASDSITPRPSPEPSFSEPLPDPEPSSLTPGPSSRTSTITTSSLPPPSSPPPLSVSRTSSTSVDVSISEPTPPTSISPPAVTIAPVPESSSLPDTPRYSVPPVTNSLPSESYSSYFVPSPSPTPSSIPSPTSVLILNSSGPVINVPSPTSLIIQTSTDMLIITETSSQSDTISRWTSTQVVTETGPGGDLTTRTVISSGTVSTDAANRPNPFTQNAGVIAGLTVGAVVATAFVVIWFFLACRRKRARASTSSDASARLEEGHRSWGPPRSEPRAPLDDDELTGHDPRMLERYGGLLAALEGPRDVQTRDDSPEHNSRPLGARSTSYLINERAVVRNSSNSGNSSQPSMYSNQEMDHRSPTLPNFPDLVGNSADSPSPPVAPSSQGHGRLSPYAHGNPSHSSEYMQFGSSVHGQSSAGHGGTSSSGHGLLSSTENGTSEGSHYNAKPMLIRGETPPTSFPFGVTEQRPEGKRLKGLLGRLRSARNSTAALSPVLPTSTATTSSDVHQARPVSGLGALPTWQFGPPVSRPYNPSSNTTGQYPWTSMEPSPYPSPTMSEDSRLPEGLLRMGHLSGVAQDSSVSLRDNVDYSRPIGRLVDNRMYSTTTVNTRNTDPDS